MLKLDIIVTHYDEPWEVGKKFFDMLAMQRGVDFGEIRVTIIHDGTAAFELPDFPFEVRQEVIEHGGVSRARNHGIEIAEAPWICFCDFDDMFASVYSLRHIVTLLPDNNYDILWSDFYSEDRMKGGALKIHRRRNNSVFIHSKLFRVEFLRKHGLQFPEDQEFNEDSAFVAIGYAICDPKRVGEIKAETPLYVWVFREGSATATRENRWKAYMGLYYRNKKVCDAFREHLPRERYLTMICRTCYDTYFMLNLTELPPELHEMVWDFREFWKAHKQEFAECEFENRVEAYNASKREHDTGDREEEERWGTTENLFDRNKTFRQWIKEIEKGGE